MDFSEPFKVSSEGAATAKYSPCGSMLATADEMRVTVRDADTLEVVDVCECCDIVQHIGRARGWLVVRVDTAEPAQNGLLIRSSSCASSCFVHVSGYSPSGNSRNIHWRSSIWDLAYIVPDSKQRGTTF